MALAESSSRLLESSLISQLESKVAAKRAKVSGTLPRNKGKPTYSGRARKLAVADSSKSGDNS